MFLSSWHRFSSLDYNKHEGLSTEFSHLNSDILLCGAVLSSGRQLDSYFRRYLPNSHIFFAYTVSSGFIHSVLVYGLDGDDLYVMDPGPG